MESVALRHYLVSGPGAPLAVPRLRVKVAGSGAPTVVGG